MELENYIGTCHSCDRVGYKWSQCWKLHGKPIQQPGSGSMQEGKYFPKIKGKGKLNQMEFLSSNSSASMVGNEAGTAGQKGDSGVQSQGTSTADLLRQVKLLMAAAEKERLPKKKLKTSII